MLLEKHDNASWGIWRIEESSEQLLSLLKEKEWYLSHLEKFKTEHRKKEWLAARVLIKQLCGEEKNILYTPVGKPFLEDNSFQISISHSKNFVAVIIDKEKPVGIDIEYTSERIKQIRSKFMHPIEENNLDKALETEHLLVHWSAKETLFKIIDEENINFKEHLHILPFIPYKNKILSFNVYETRTKKQNRYQVNYLITDHYILTYIG